MKKMLNLNKLSLPAKLALSFIIVGALTISLTATSMFFISRNNLRNQVREQLQDYVRLATLQINGDTFDRLRQPSDIQSEAFQTMLAQMKAITQQSPNVADVYGLRREPDGKILFVMDATADSPAQLGDEYTDAGPTLAANFAKAQDAYTEDDFYTDAWGTWLSGYAPIRKADGVIVGLLAVDFSAQKVLAAEDAALRMLIISLAVSIILMAVATYFISSFFLSPLPQLARIAGLVAEGKMADLGKNQQKMANFMKRQDEIGILAGQFNNLTLYFVEMAQAAQRIASGDLTIEVQPRSQDDILGQAFFLMTANLRNLLSHVAENAKSLSSASSVLTEAANQSREATSQIADTMQQVARGTNQQADSVSQTAASAESMSRSIHSVSEGARQQAEAITRANQTTQQLNDYLKKLTSASSSVADGGANASRASKEGAATVNETIQAINQIRSSVGTSADKVKEMGQRSDQIGAIVETIDDIASQTNLLALNAAIEAARAGEQGKGFSVVADEVRKLAERSSRATKEIGSLIKGIQSTIQEAVSAMNTSLTAVDRGVEKAQQANQALESILKTADIVQKVSARSVEVSQQAAHAADELISAMDSVSAVADQNAGATQNMTANATVVTESIESIASVSEENSAAVEEVSASTEEMTAQVQELNTSAQSLSEMALSLQELVDQFKLAGK